MTAGRLLEIVRSTWDNEGGPGALVTPHPDLTPSREGLAVKATPKVCTVEHCVGRVNAKGLCHKHYARLRRHGSVDALFKAEREATCSISGCNGEHAGLGLCQKHYVRLKKHGDPLKTLIVVDPADRLDWEKYIGRKVPKRPEIGCWEWSGWRSDQNYPMVQCEGHQSYAHRKSYELANGPIPDGMEVDHICFNPPCVRPDHLQLLTPLENSQRQRTVVFNRCRRGHLFTPENTQINATTGYRTCRMCWQARYDADKANGKRRVGGPRNAR